MASPPHPVQLPTRSPFQRTDSNNLLPLSCFPSGNSSDWSEQSYFSDARVPSMNAGWLRYGSPATLYAMAYPLHHLAPPPPPPPPRFPPLLAYAPPPEPLYTLTHSQLTQMVLDLAVEAPPRNGALPAQAVPQRDKTEIQAHERALCLLLKQAWQRNDTGEDAQHSAALGLQHYEAIRRFGLPTAQTIEKVIVLLGRAHRGSCALKIFRRDCTNSCGRLFSRTFYNHMLSALVHSGLNQEAQSLLLEMPLSGQTPNIYSYNTLVFGAVRAKDWKSAEFLCKLTRLAIPGPLHEALKKTLLSGVAHSNCLQFLWFAEKQLTGPNTVEGSLTHHELCLLGRRLRRVSPPAGQVFCMLHPEVSHPQRLNSRP